MIFFTELSDLMNSALIYHERKIKPGLRYYFSQFVFYNIQSAEFF